MRTKNKLLIFSLLCFGTNSFGAEAANSERNVVSSSSAQAPNIQNSANNSANQNNKAGMVSQIVGVANMGLGAMNMQKFAASCGKTPPGCMYPYLAKAILHFGMGALSFKQASKHAGSEYGSNLTGIDTSAWNNPFGDPNANGKPVDHLSNDDSGKDKGLAAVVNTGKFNEIKRDLFGPGINGVRMDPKTGKIIDSNTGKTYDPASMADSKAMADAGFGSSDIASALDASSKAEKAAMKKLGITESIGAATAENGYADGAGNLGTLSGGGADVAAEGGMGGGRGIASTGAGVKVPSNQIAGLTKNFNGERIGVSAENIFNMMTRRYKTKEKQNSFFDPSELVKMPQ